MGEGCWPAGKTGRRVLWSGRQRGSPQGLQSGRKPQGGSPWSGRGIRVAEGHRNPRVEVLPRGEKTSGVILKGDRVPGEDGQGRGGDGKSVSTRDTEGSSNISCGEAMESNQDLAAPPSTQRGTAEGERGDVIMQRHSNGVNGARPEQGALVRRKYGLLEPGEPAGDSSAARPKGIGDSPKDTTTTRGTDGRETKTGERNGQCVPLTRDQTEDKEEEQGPHERQHVLNLCSHQGGGGRGTPHLATRAHHTQPGDGRGPPWTGSGIPHRAARGRRRGRHPRAVTHAPRA